MHIPLTGLEIVRGRVEGDPLVPPLWEEENNKKNWTKQRKREKKGASPGIEPGTSRTLSEKHASRPTGRLSRHKAGKITAPCVHK